MIVLKVFFLICTSHRFIECMLPCFIDLVRAWSQFQPNCTRLIPSSEAQRQTVDMPTVCEIRMASCIATVLKFAANVLCLQGINPMCNLVIDSGRQNGCSHLILVVSNLLSRQALSVLWLSPSTEATPTPVWTPSRRRSPWKLCNWLKRDSPLVNRSAGNTNVHYLSTECVPYMRKVSHEITFANCLYFVLRQNFHQF